MVVSQTQAVGRILGEYIAVHEDIFGGGFLRAMRRLVPIPGFFKAIDFEHHAIVLSGLRQEIDAARDSVDIALSPSQIEGSLVAYCNALATTITYLEHICRRLASRKNSPDSYTRAEYEADLGIYEQAVAGYRALGADLNYAMDSLRRRASEAAVRSQALSAALGDASIQKAILSQGFEVSDLEEMYEHLLRCGYGQEKARRAVRNPALVGFYFSRLPKDKLVKDMDFIIELGAWVNTDPDAPAPPR